MGPVVHNGPQEGCEEARGEEGGPEEGREEAREEARRQEGRQEAREEVGEEVVEEEVECTAPCGHDGTWKRGPVPEDQLLGRPASQFVCDALQFPRLVLVPVASRVLTCELVFATVLSNVLS